MRRTVFKLNPNALKGRLIAIEFEPKVDLHGQSHKAHCPTTKPATANDCHCPMQAQFAQIKQLADCSKGVISAIASVGHTFLTCSLNAPAKNKHYSPPHIFFEYACPPYQSHFKAFCVADYGAFNKAFQDHKDTILAPLKALAANDYAGLCGRYANIKGIVGEAIKLHSLLAGDEETPDSFAHFNKYYLWRLNMGASYEYVSEALTYGGHLAGKVRALNHLFEQITNAYEALCNPSKVVHANPGSNCKCGGLQYIKQLEQFVFPDPKNPAPDLYDIQRAIDVYAFSIGNSFSHSIPDSIDGCTFGATRNIVAFKPDYTVQTPEYQNMMKSMNTLSSIQGIVSKLGVYVNCNPEVQTKAAALSNSLGTFSKQFINYSHKFTGQFPTTALDTIIKDDPGQLVGGVINGLGDLINTYYAGCPTPVQHEEISMRRKVLKSNPSVLKDYIEHAIEDLGQFEKDEGYQAYGKQMSQYKKNSFLGDVLPVDNPDLYTQALPAIDLNTAKKSLAAGANSYPDGEALLKSMGVTPPHIPTGALPAGMKLGFDHAGSVAPPHHTMPPQHGYQHHPDHSVNLERLIHIIVFYIKNQHTGMCEPLPTHLHEHLHMVHAHICVKRHKIENVVFPGFALLLEHLAERHGIAVPLGGFQHHHLVKIWEAIKKDDGTSHCTSLSTGSGGNILAHKDQFDQVLQIGSSFKTLNTLLAELGSVVYTFVTGAKANVGDIGWFAESEMYMTSLAGSINTNWGEAQLTGNTPSSLASILSDLNSKVDFGTQSDMQAAFQVIMTQWNSFSPQIPQMYQQMPNISTGLTQIEGFKTLAEDIERFKGLYDEFIFNNAKGKK